MSDYEIHPIVNTSDQVVIEPHVRVGLMMARLLRTYDVDTQDEPSEQDYQRGYREPVTDRCDLQSGLGKDMFTAFRLRGTRTYFELEGDDETAEEHPLPAACVELEYCELPPVSDRTAVDSTVDDNLPWQQYVLAILRQTDDIPEEDDDFEGREIDVDLLWRATGSKLGDQDINMVHAIVVAMEREMLSLVDSSMLAEVPRPYDIFVPMSEEHHLPDSPNSKPALSAPARRLLFAEIPASNDN